MFIWTHFIFERIILDWFLIKEKLFEGFLKYTQFQVTFVRFFLHKYLT